MENADFNLPEGLLIRKVRANWLTQKPKSQAYMVAALSMLLLLVANFIFWRNEFNSADWMTAIPQNVFEKHQYWRLWSALLAHADIGHLLSNSLLFSIFAFFLYGYFGSAVFPLMAFFFGGITNYLVLQTLPTDSELLGVSGVVYWMGACWLTLYLLLDTRDQFSRRLIKSVGIAAVLFIPEAYHQNVSYLSHFIGFIFGSLFAAYYYFLNRSKFKSAEVIELIEA